MKYPLRLHLGSLAIELTLSNKAFFKLARNRYHDCLTQDKPHFRLEVRLSPFREGNPGSLARVEYTDCWKARRYDFRAEWKGKTGTVQFRRFRITSFDSFLRVFVATMLPSKNGLLLHSAGIVRKGRAYVFTGPSGFGKSTVCALSPHDRVLSDEIVALNFSRGRFWVRATPFWGSLGTGPCPRKRYPLALVSFLRKSRIHATAPAAPAQSVAKLLRCVCRFDVHGPAAEKILDFVSALVVETPCRELWFRKDPGFWRLLESE